MTSARGFSVVELAFVLGVVATTCGIAIPQALATLDDMRTLGAVRYLSTRLHETRMEAVRRSKHTAIRFTLLEQRYVFRIYTDGNNNGIRSADIQSGVDPALRPPERLSDQFAQVDFGTLPGLPAVDPSSSPPGSDPIRVGTSRMVVFTALGTATPGSLYVKSRRAQYVVRIFGETGKIRILRFNERTGKWTAL
jgi:hypothetical protein